ncbi:MAG: hypothetical protein AAGF24_09920 [Cyanobacteria bacterium P01_H01_bin.121]
MVLKIPSFAKTETQWPVWSGLPRPYQFDGYEGVLRIGTQDQLGSITLQPLLWNLDPLTERWGRASQTWLDVAGIDQDGFVCQLSLKKASAINVLSFIQKLQGGGVEKLDGYAVDPRACLLSLKPEGMVGADGTPYYTLQVSDVAFVSEDHYQKAVEFIEGDQFNWVLFGEVA